MFITDKCAFLFSTQSFNPTLPLSPEYLIALSSKIITSLSSDFGSPYTLTKGCVSVMSFTSFSKQVASKARHAPSVIEEKSTSCFGNSLCSSLLNSSISFMSPFILSICVLMESIHFSLSCTVEVGSLLTTERLVAMIVSGVFNSCEALAIKSLCFVIALATGWRSLADERRDRSATSITEQQYSNATSTPVLDNCL